MLMIGILGEDKKANWPSHLVEIVHTYNATQFAVTRYNPHYLMFRQWPRLPVDFVFPTISSNKAPMREASARHVDKYVASVWDRLRTTLWEGTSPIKGRSTLTKTVLQQKDRCSDLEAWQPGTSACGCF